MKKICFSVLKCENFLEELKKYPFENKIIPNFFLQELKESENQEEFEEFCYRMMCFTYFFMAKYAQSDITNEEIIKLYMDEFSDKKILNYSKSNLREIMNLFKDFYTPLSEVFRNIFKYNLYDAETEFAYNQIGSSEMIYAKFRDINFIETIKKRSEESPQEVLYFSIGLKEEKDIKIYKTLDEIEEEIKNCNFTSLIALFFHPLEKKDVIRLNYSFDISPSIDENTIREFFKKISKLFNEDNCFKDRLKKRKQIFVNEIKNISKIEEIISNLTDIQIKHLSSLVKLLSKVRSNPTVESELKSSLENLQKKLAFKNLGIEKKVFFVRDYLKKEFEIEFSETNQEYDLNALKKEILFLQKSSGFFSQGLYLQKIQIKEIFFEYGLKKECNKFIKNIEKFPSNINRLKEEIEDIKKEINGFVEGKRKQKILQSLNKTSLVLVENIDKNYESLNSKFSILLKEIICLIEKYSKLEYNKNLEENIEQKYSEYIECLSNRKKTRNRLSNLHFFEDEKFKISLKEIIFIFSVIVSRATSKDKNSIKDLSRFYKHYHMKFISKTDGRDESNKKIEYFILLLMEHLIKIYHKYESEIDLEIKKEIKNNHEKLKKAITKLIDANIEEKKNILFSIQSKNDSFVLFKEVKEQILSQLNI